MAESYYYLVKFTATCEECGKHFEGVIAKEVPVNDSAIAGNILNSLADSADAGIRRKAVESAVKQKRWSDLDLCYGLTEHECPHCFARQSWDPMEKPVEPKQKESAGSKAINIGCFTFAGLFSGVLGAFVVYIVLLMVFDIDNYMPAFLVTATATIVGVVWGVRSNKEDAEKLDSTYDERMAAYQRELAAYEAYQQRLRDNPTRNDPQVDLSSGHFVSSLEATYAKQGLDWRDF